MEEPLRDIKSPIQRSFFKEYFLQKTEYGAAQAYSGNGRRAREKCVRHRRGK